VALVFAVLGAVVVFVIAAVVVGREAFRLGHQPRAAIVDVDEAVNHVADHLDEAHAARITYAEVRQIVQWYLDHLRRRGVAARPGRELPAGTGPVVVDDDAVAVALERVDSAGLDLTDTDVLVVVDLVVDYLAQIGAVGPEVLGPDDPFAAP
jgi:hypothetical protein